ncbi:MAG: Z-ring associated protein ZapG [Enterobacteriaceae bacterium]
MPWIYMLIGLIIGVVIGALVMRYGNSKLRQQQALQSELEKSQQQLETYRRELVGHFAQSAELLNNMAQDYRKLYQHMAQSSNNLLPDLPVPENPFQYRLGESEAENDTLPVERPRDYSDGASGLFPADRP